jgi:hypothetical protein
MGRSFLEHPVKSGYSRKPLRKERFCILRLKQEELMVRMIHQLNEAVSGIESGGIWFRKHLQADTTCFIRNAFRPVDGIDEQELANALPLKSRRRRQTTKPEYWNVVWQPILMWLWKVPSPDFRQTDRIKPKRFRAGRFWHRYKGRGNPLGLMLPCYSFEPDVEIFVTTIKVAAKFP